MDNHRSKAATMTAEARGNGQKEPRKNGRSKRVGSSSRSRRKSSPGAESGQGDEDALVAPTSCASLGDDAAPISASSLASKTVGSFSTEFSGSVSVDAGRHGENGENGEHGEKRSSRDRYKDKKSTRSKKKSSSDKSSRRREREQKAADAAAQAAQDQLRQQLSSLRLPHMPPLTREAFGAPPQPQPPGSMASSKKSRRRSASTTTTTAFEAQAPASKADPPTIRILVVADIDLASASALAESAIVASSGRHQRRNQLSASASTSCPDSENVFDRVDLCIACGPFCTDDDLQPFFKGRQRLRRMRIPTSPSMTPMLRMTRTSFYSAATATASSHARLGGGSSHYAAINLATSGAAASFPQSFRRQSRLENTSAHRRRTATPMPPLMPALHKRSKEETAALEGLMTAAISQLESIVCRVVFVPGHTDPISTISSFKEQHFQAASAPASALENQQLRHVEEQRLTPNARNIHQGWMPLCPGLGCSGLLYINRKQLQPAAQSSSSESSDEEDDSSTPSDSEYEHDNEINHSSNDDESTEYDDDDDDALKYVAAKTSMNSLSEHLEAHSTHRNRYRSGNESASADHTTSHVTATTEGTTVASSSIAVATASSSVMTKEYDTEFCNSLEKLVKLAPPIRKVAENPAVPNIAPLCSTSLFQSILVTNFHHSIEGADDDDTSDNSSCDPNASVAPSVYDNIGNEQVEEEEEGSSHEESFDPPWPKEHEAFCALPLVQEHVLLEIASGRNSSGRIVQPMELPKGKMRVVLPGSLRERGEFCLVDVAFMKDTSSTAVAAAAGSNRLPRSVAGDYRWRVRRTRFHTLNEYL